MSISPGANAEGHCCIYGQTPDGLTYLVNGLFPAAQQISLSVGQDAEAVIAQLKPETRWFAWHTFLTYKSGVPRSRDALTDGLQQRGILTINAGVTDVSKRHLQSVLAQLYLPTTIAAPEGDPDEMLFFKSNHNFGGHSERHLPEEVREFFGVALPHPSAPQFNGYRAAKRMDISPKAFEIDDVFIERFVGNTSEVFYRAFVTFDAVVLSRLVCKDVIKKALHADARDDYFLSFSDAGNAFSSAPDETAKKIMIDLHRFCVAFKFEMGAVDVLLDDHGTPHIIDVNPTSYGGGNCERPGFLEHLGKGLRGHSERSMRMAV